MSTGDGAETTALDLVSESVNEPSKLDFVRSKDAGGY